MPPASDPKLRLLVRHSAAPKDVALAEELLGHLRPLEHVAGLDVWSDARIRAGDDWRQEIRRAIDQADVALLLLSADFFASDVLQEVEVPRLLERHRAGQLRVVPVLLRSCLWDVHPWLRELHPLPKDQEPVASRQGEARDRVLTEVAREIVGLATPATGSTPANQRPPEPVQGLTKPSGDTYHIQIHGSTIGAFGAGPGVDVNGQVVEQQPATVASTAPDRSGPRPLVVLGPHVVAEGERVAVAGNIWTLHLYRFVVGDETALGTVADANLACLPGDRCVVLSDPGEARAIAGNLTCRKRGEYIEVEVPVSPPGSKESVMLRHDMDPETGRDARGVPVGVAVVRNWMCTPVGHFSDDNFGSWVPIWLQASDIQQRASELVRIDLLRLASVPRIGLHEESRVPLAFVERVLSVAARPDEGDEETFPVEVELTFVGGGPWKGEILVARRLPDPEAYAKLMRSAMAAVSGV